jgi:hypothetical protein
MTFAPRSDRDLEFIAFGTCDELLKRRLLPTVECSFDFQSAARKGMAPAPKFYSAMVGTLLGTTSSASVAAVT